MLEHDAEDFSGELYLDSIEAGNVHATVEGLGYSVTVTFNANGPLNTPQPTSISSAPSEAFQAAQSTYRLALRVSWELQHMLASRTTPHLTGDDIVNLSEAVDEHATAQMWLADKMREAGDAARADSPMMSWALSDEDQETLREMRDWDDQESASEIGGWEAEDQEGLCEIKDWED